MNYKIRHLIHMMDKDDECEDYVIYIPKDGQVIMAYDESEPMRNDKRRMIQQVEIHNDERYPYTVVMENDYDNPITDVTNIKFEIHEAVVVIG